MHMIIQVIVYGKDKNEAETSANSVFNFLCGENFHPFDYFTIIPDETVPAFSVKGMKLIANTWKQQCKEFKNNLKKIRKKIFLPRKRLMNDRLWRQTCECISPYQSSYNWLYDGDGEAISTREHLKDVLEKWKCIYESNGKENPYRNLNIYVVSADVHY